jgi:hypothetical protein
MKENKPRLHDQHVDIAAKCRSKHSRRKYKLGWYQPTDES